MASSFNRSLAIGILSLVLIVVDGSSVLVGSVPCFSKTMCTSYNTSTRSSAAGGGSVSLVFGNMRMLTMGVIGILKREWPH